MRLRQTKRVNHSHSQSLKVQAACHALNTLGNHLKNLKAARRIGLSQDSDSIYRAPSDKCHCLEAWQTASHSHCTLHKN